MAPLPDPGSAVVGHIGDDPNRFAFLMPEGMTVALPEGVSVELRPGIEVYLRMANDKGETKLKRISAILLLMQMGVNIRIELT